MFSERGVSLPEVLIVMVIVGTLAAIALQSYTPIINMARVNSDIFQGRLIKDAIDLYQITEGTQPASISDLERFLSHVTSSQEINGHPISVDDSNHGKPVFDIDLYTGRVKVFNTAGKVVWDSK